VIRQCSRSGIRSRRDSDPVSSRSIWNVSAY
jgi:hypothetical protein